MIQVSSTYIPPPLPGRSYCARILILVHLLVCALVSCTAHAGVLELEVGELSSPAALLQGLEIQWDTQAQTLAFGADRLHVSEESKGLELRQLEGRCGEFSMEDILRCDQASLALQIPELELKPTALTARFSAAADIQTASVSSSGQLSFGSLKGPFEFSRSPEGQFGGWFDPSDLPIVKLSEMLETAPAAVEWVNAGVADLRLRIPGEDGEAFQLDAAVTGLGFDSPEGRFAAEGLGADLMYAPELDASGSYLSGEFVAGQLLMDTVYIDFSERQPDFEINFPESGEGSDTLAFSGTWMDGSTLQARFDVILDASNQLQNLVVSRLMLDLEQGYEVYLDGPARAAGFGLDTASGSVQGELSYAPETNWLVELDLDAVSLVDDRDRYSITGISGDLNWNQPSAASLVWNAASLFDLPLGPAQLHYRADDGRLAFLEPLRIPVLGGQLTVPQFRFDGNASGPGQLAIEAELKDLSMARLSGILSWPELRGSLSGSIPRVSLENGSVEMQGTLQLDLFDGQATVDGLRIERLFGVAPALAANLRFQNLDMQLVTGAFSFGEITGRLDGQMIGLRLLNWNPVAFDAYFQSPEEKTQERRISQRALDNITSIGGGAGAVSSTFLRVFDDFGYRRLGVGCELRNQICRLAGLEPVEDQGLLLVEGAGIPKIRVIAFNRLVNWPRLLAQLKAATEGAGPRIGSAVEDQSP